MNNVKNISIKGFLAGRGNAPKMERGGYGMYLSPLREERTPSFKVDYGQNLWYDFGLGEGGSIIDLVARMENCSVGEAIRRLENDGAVGGLQGANTNANIGARTVSSSFHRNAPVAPYRPEPATSRIEIVSVGELNHPALVGYLRERGIDLTAARKYCNEIRYRIGGREYFAIGFKNDAGGWELRNRSFKGSSTPKNITTIRNDSDTVMVFEGFIDFLSYLSLKASPLPTIDTAVLNSVANLRKAIPFLQSHRTIHAFLDNDDAGRKTLADLYKSLPGSEVVDQSAFYRNYKDLNDYRREQAASRNRVVEPNTADKVRRQAPAENSPTIPKNRASKDNAAVQIKRPTPTEKATTADRFRRSVAANPVRKKGRGL